MMSAVRVVLRPTVLLCGRGLHSGREARVRVSPGPAGAGVVFVRHDLDGRAVRASLDRAVPAARRLLLEEAGVQVSTPEHLLAALCGLEIADAVVDLWGEEVPILDGSAAVFVEALLPVTAEREAPAAPGWEAVGWHGLRAGTATCWIAPDEELRLEGRIDFGVALPPQRLVWRQADLPAFAARLARARTFGFVDEAGGLRARRLARGAGLRSVLVYGPAGPLNPEGTRFRDEAVRHKLLDALGALALLGGPLRGRLVLCRCGHALLVATLRSAIAAGALRRG